ncbi:glycosyltransferase [Psychroserpens algicola]|uniref:glycosyltransferase n=1 Tax=Psychroserpens algicola TaxID=1719034 RepID=UPI0019540EDD|nr:glycosyltransferase [Psychroserpens algicola]
MKLSVVIPSYNAAQFIESSYQSIINQGVEDIEIIYVDNNSTDGTAEEIKKIQKRDSRVSSYFQPKQGAAPTRNKGLVNAKGEYVYFFDVDDGIYPNALLKMIDVLDAHTQVDAVVGKMVKSSQSIEKTTKPDDETLEVTIHPKPYFGLIWFSDLSKVVGPPAFMYRRTVFDTIGIYNEDLRIGQDTALDIKLGMMCDIAFIDMYVYMYYKHTDSTIEKNKKKTPRAFMQWPRLVKEHLPFYLEHDTPEEFNKLLFEQLYKVMGKQVFFTEGFAQRKTLKNDLLQQVSAIEVPFLIRFFLSLLVVFPFSSLLKFYGYYIVPYIVKK